MSDLPYWNKQNTRQNRCGNFSYIRKEAAQGPDPWEKEKLQAHIKTLRNGFDEWQAHLQWKHC